MAFRILKCIYIRKFMVHLLWYIWTAHNTKLSSLCLSVFMLPVKKILKIVLLCGEAFVPMFSISPVSTFFKLNSLHSLDALFTYLRLVLDLVLLQPHGISQQSQLGGDVGAY